VLFNFENKEKYYIDIPFKEYYKNLNESISIELIELFKTKGKFKQKQFIYFSYNYFKGENERFEIYNIELSSDLVANIGRRWLPILHSGIFHDVKAYKCKNIIDVVGYKGEKLNLFFFIDSIKVEDLDGHINFTFYNEDDKVLTQQEIRKNVDALYGYKSPLLKAKSLEVLIPEYKKQTKRKSLLNALSTVLNRNGSHNIGSHVLAVLSDESLVSNFITGISKDDVRYAPIFFDKTGHARKVILEKKEELKNKFCDETQKEIKKLEKKATSETIAQIAYFNAYLKNRLDLLAAVGTSGETVMLNNKPFFQGVFKNFERNQILLEHISGKGDDFIYRFNLTINNKSLEELKEKDLQSDIEVAIPNDLLGDQAFYLLLENVIRNTAKHGTYNGEKGVVFTINVCDYHNDDDFYLIELSDDNYLQERFDIEKESRKEDRDFNKLEDIIKETNLRIDKDILKDDFNIREGGWGTIEMKIACCYLSGLPLRKIDDDVYRADRKGIENKRKPILEAFHKKVKKVDETTGKETGKSHLGYRFYISKPKSVLVIDIKDNLKTNEAIDISALKSKGIDILNQEEFSKAIEKRTIFKHQFIVAFAKQEPENLEKLMCNWYLNKQLPNRCLFIEDISQITDKILDTCYQIELDKANPSSKYKKENKYVIALDGAYLPIYGDVVDLSEAIQELDYYEKATFDYHKFKSPTGKTIYSEPYGSVSSFNQFKQGFKNIEKQKYICFNLLEAVRTKVFIIDERVQNSLGNIFIQDYDSDGDNEAIVNFSQIYKATKIIVPNKEDGNEKLNLNKVQDNKVEIIKYIRKTLKNDSINFFILHFGILEKLVPNGGKESFKNLLNDFRKLSSLPVKIILTSGRGIPSDLPENEYFCNFSSINYYTNDRVGRSKLHLLQLLQNQRAL
jgi:hypothetical protein